MPKRGARFPQLVTYEPSFCCAFEIFPFRVEVLESHRRNVAEAEAVPTGSPSNNRYIVSTLTVKFICNTSFPI